MKSAVAKRREERNAKTPINLTLQYKYWCFSWSKRNVITNDLTLIKSLGLKKFVCVCAWYFDYKQKCQFIHNLIILTSTVLVYLSLNIFCLFWILCACLIGISFILCLRIDNIFAYICFGYFNIIFVGFLWNKAAFFLCATCWPWWIVKLFMLPWMG